MKQLTMGLVVWVGVLLLGAGGFVNASDQVTYDPRTPQTVIQHNKCNEIAGRGACMGFAVRPKIPVYTSADSSSRILERFDMHIYTELLEPTENPNHPGWISVAALDRDQHVVGWIRHTDIVLTTDLRRVTGCWPIETLNWDEEEVGDYPGGKFRLRFDTNGRILPDKPGAQKEWDTNIYFSKNFAVYYDRGVFLIAHHTDPEAESSGFAIIFMLDYPKRKVIHSAPAQKPSWRLYPDAKLKGCTEIPRVDPNERMKFKK